jgi:LmbE family N-acetylglucosaminyl deacetylase
LISRPRLAFCLFLIFELTIGICAIVMAFLVAPHLLVILLAAALGSSLFVAVGLLCVVRVASYRELVGYEPRADYRYAFDHSSATQIDCKLDADGFVWPDVAGEWDTAFVRVRVRSTLLGRLFDPNMEIRSRHLHSSQYLERGVAGVRYLNISAFVRDRPVPGQRFWLSWRHVKQKGADVRLILFRNEPLTGRVLVIAPHPDDAEIAAFGVYSESDAFVVTISAGDAGGFKWPRMFPQKDMDAMIRAKVRVWDSVMVPSLGGVTPENAINLGYFDGTLYELFESPGREARNASTSVFDVKLLSQFNRSSLFTTERTRSTWETLVGELTELLQKLRPSVIVTPHPFIDSHLDHPFATIALCEALRHSGLNEGRMLCYTNHLPINEMYPLGPAESVVTLPPNFARSVSFEKIYSHPLSPQRRELKFLALEAMHDLRAPPVFRRTLSTEFRSFMGQLYAEVTGLERDPHSYFRRAVRPNEIFFVMSYAQGQALAADFIRGWRERRGRIGMHAGKPAPRAGVTLAAGMNITAGVAAATDAVSDAASQDATAI